MRFFDYNKRKPKENKTLMITRKDYGWGKGCTVAADVAVIREDKCYLSMPLGLEKTLPLEDIIKWSYIN